MLTTLASISSSSRCPVNPRQRKPRCATIPDITLVSMSIAYSYCSRSLQEWCSSLRTPHTMPGHAGELLTVVGSAIHSGVSAAVLQENLQALSEGLMGASPPDFADLDLNIGEDLAAFADQMSPALPLDMSHTIEWLPSTHPADNAESAQHAARRQPGA